MSADNKLVFADFDPVTGKPTLDGFVTVDAGVNTPEAEPGYVNGGKMTLGGAGLPPVVIQTVKDGDTIVIGISCRGDSSFDDIDGVVVAFRPSGTSSNGAQRRVDVFPVWGDVPDAFDPMNLGIGWGAAKPDLDPMHAGDHLPEAADNATYDIRTNKPPHIGPVWYARNSDSGNWTVDPPANVGDTNKFNVRVRSWKPSVDAPPPECAWSIEIRVPINTAVGGADWINLNDDFGLFVDVFRAWRFDDGGALGYQATQFRFPRNALELEGVIGTSTDIPAASFGHGLMKSAASQGEGVRFKNGAMGIGRRPKNNPAAPLTNVISGTEDNVLVAQLENTGPAVTDVRTEVRFANWGLGAGQFTAWHPGACDNPSPLINLGPGTLMTPASGETLHVWNAGDVPDEYKPPHHHQCMWVQLDALTDVTFSQSSARRNMDFAGLSEIKRDAEISGAGYPEPAEGEHEFVLFTRCRKIVLQELLKDPRSIDPLTLNLVNGALHFDAGEKRDVFLARESMVSTQGQQWVDYVVYLWITEGFRRTGRTVEINGIKAEILDNAPGDFGIAARHQGVNDSLNWSLSGGGLVRHRAGMVSVKVPHKGTVTIGVRISANRDQAHGDVSELPKAPPFNPIKPQEQQQPDKPVEGPGGDGPGNGGTRPDDLPKGCLALLMGIFGKKPA
jgi:hypothetical protein